jgi:hypothetical protein
VQREDPITLTGLGPQTLSQCQQSTSAFSRLYSCCLDGDVISGKKRPPPETRTNHTALALRKCFFRRIYTLGSVSQDVLVDMLILSRTEMFPIQCRFSHAWVANKQNEFGLGRQRRRERLSISNGRAQFSLETGVQCRTLPDIADEASYPRNRYSDADCPKKNSWEGIRSRSLRDNQRPFIPRACKT